MVKANPNLASLKKGYLFPEIQKRKEAFLKEEPDAKLISLGIGDTTHPIVSSVANRMMETARSLGTPEGYTGYGTDKGDPLLRHKLS